MTAIDPTGVAATVVLYNSPVSCLPLLNTYWQQVARLYIIDNSPKPTQWVLTEFAENPAVVYRHLPQNAGIATALNTAARLAIADGFGYLLTMDDDSQAPPDMVAQLLDYLATVPDHTVGIVSPRHVLTTAANRLTANPQPTPVLTTMSSGNLLDLTIYQWVGPFRDDLFIDVVDHEFTLRLHAAGYRVIELPAVLLTHRLGEQKRVPFTGVTFVSHTPARNYYLVRNSLIVIRQYGRRFPAYAALALRTIAIETVKAALLEDKRLRRLQLIGKALTDGWRGKTGPLTGTQ